MLISILRWLTLLIFTPFCCLTTAQNEPFIYILGVAQDAGYPQINCEKEYCAEAWENSSLQKKPACLAIVDPSTKEQWIVDATPEIKNQLYQLNVLQDYQN